MSYRFPPTIGSPGREALRLLARLSGVLALVVGLTIFGCWWPAFGFLLFLIGLLALPVTLVLFGMAASTRLAKAAAGRAAARRFAVILIAPALTILAFAAAFPALWAGSFIGSETLLITYLSRYRGIIERVQREPVPTAGSGIWRRDGGITYIADYGTPRRVAFEPSGFLDNWSGIIWDPTHDVMQARGFDARTGHFHAPDRITKLFGGDLVGCRRLGGDWFDCSFT